MSIKPIDMQAMIPKTQQISKTQKVQNEKQEIFLHNQATYENKKIERDLKKINEAKQGYKIKVNNNDSSNNKKQKNRKNKDKKNNNGKNKIEFNKMETGNLIDVKI